MARKTTVTLEDDLAGGPAAETLRFGIDSVEYEIDLSKPNAAKFRHDMAPFVEHARKAGRLRRGPRRTAASRQRSREVRAWAKEQGIELSERGRIPSDVVDQYEAHLKGSLLAGWRGRGADSWHAPRVLSARTHDMHWDYAASFAELPLDARGRA